MRGTHDKKERLKLGLWGLAGAVLDNGDPRAEGPKVPNRTPSRNQKDTIALRCGAVTSISPLY